MTETEMQIEPIEVFRIYSDEDFNCRGYIPPSSVLDLARDISTNGLQQPITIQPLSEEYKSKLKTNCDFRIVQGHRRYTAMTAGLQWTVIPCIIKEGLSELQALLVNLNENLQREQLNIVQEARALRRLKEQGLGSTDIAKALRKDRSWVQTRMYVLDFPEDIQEEIRTGMITQGEMHELHSLDENLWYEGVRQIKTKKLNAAKEGKRIRKIGLKTLRPPKPDSLQKAKRRTDAEIITLLDHLGDFGIPNSYTRTLAWAAGEVSTIDLLTEYKKHCYDTEGFVYTIPPGGIAGL